MKAGTFAVLLCAVLAAPTPDARGAVPCGQPAGTPMERPGWPLPPCSQSLLFYVQRSSNPNTVVYAVPEGTPGEEGAAIEVYWLRFNTDGRRRALGFFEDAFAYGVTVEPAGRSGTRRFSVNGYPERPALLEVPAGRRPRVVVDIDGRPAVLHRVWVEVDEDALTPAVRYVDLHGATLDGGLPVRERITPGQ